MSELSDAEKRRLLRERRQKKFGNGGASSRLNKITGQVPDSQLDTSSPLDSPSSAEASETPVSSERAVGNTASTLEMDELIASVSKPPSSGMPPRSQGTRSVREDGSKSPQSADPQLDLFKRLMGSQQSDGSEPDLMSIFQSMNGDGDGETPTPFETEPVDQRMLDYHNFLVNRLKAWSILLKWLILSLYVYLITKESASHNLSLPQWLIEPSSFFPVFVGFEIVATSIYYQRLQSIEKSNNVDTLRNNSKIAKLVSLLPAQGHPIANLKGKILMALQYWDVLSMLITDVCFVLIAMGVCSYL
ncbi:hypothetical protein HG536_0C05270 [Torulaspora globosa]|uniref:Golgi to ER traffic protein 2 n=1 Tax=Torulaspora globosa TaxID=48254 RepID=A0A7G3ZFS2_9SACH|nr:uncharacterized protein HG536_0C05270 [Torulaspora globosa]QLL32358.1 hypothetical protein HG536_0C05270 [Torulaspora globosa]